MTPEIVLCLGCSVDRHDDCKGVALVVDGWHVVRKECRCKCRQLDTRPLPK